MHQHPADFMRGPVRPLRCSQNGPADDGIRWGLVERIRKEIAEGTYDTEDKLEKALERLVEEME